MGVGQSPAGLHAVGRDPWTVYCAGRTSLLARDSSEHRTPSPGLGSVSPAVHTLMQYADSDLTSGQTRPRALARHARGAESLVSFTSSHDTPSNPIRSAGGNRFRSPLAIFLLFLLNGFRVPGSRFRVPILWFLGSWVSGFRGHLLCLTLQADTHRRVASTGRRGSYRVLGAAGAFGRRVSRLSMRTADGSDPTPIYRHHNISRAPSGSNRRDTLVPVLLRRSSRQAAEATRARVLAWRRLASYRRRIDTRSSPPDVALILSGPTTATTRLH